MLDARTDLTELARYHPGLAERFASLRDSLDTAGDRGWRSERLPAGSAMAADGDAEFARLELERRREIAEEFDAVIEQIRAEPGFAGFLRPPPVSDLAAAAGDGPVVIVNVSRFGSHALILTSGGVLEPVRLDDLTPDRLAVRVAGFLTALGTAPATRAAGQALTGVLGWMWDTIAGPVLDRLGITGPPPASQPWPRLWWCVPGLLSFLPLHAAGHHQTRFDANPATVADRVVSSYTPTIRALAHARRARRAAGGGPDQAVAGHHLLVVAMPRTPGAPDLPGARAEADLLRKHFPDRTTTLTGAQATRDTVLSALPGAVWAHFACHGYCDPVSPSASRLLLHDHQQHPLTVTDVTRLRQEQADLAFLSACSTARPGDRLADEAIHLASAFQLAGYRHVIGTLWPISDDHAVQVADDLYAELAAAGSAAATARALRDATVQLRNRWQRTPSVWASHIHVGALPVQLAGCGADPLGDHRVGEGGVGQGGGGQARLDGQCERSDELGGVRPQDLSSGQAAAVAVPDELDEPFRLCQDLGPGVLRVVVAGHVDVSEPLLRGLLGETGLGGLGLGEHRHRHRLDVHRVHRLTARKDHMPGHQALADRGVEQHAQPVHIPGGVDVGVGGTHLMVDRRGLA